MSGSTTFDWNAARDKIAKLRLGLERGGERPPAERAQILRKRAQRLARPPQSAAEENREEALIVVGAGAERFAIPLAGVVEVVRHPRCASVPFASPAVAGVIQLRGEIRPVFHLTWAVQLPALLEGAPAVVLLLRRGAGEAGLLVERVEDIRTDGVGRKPAPAGSPHILWLTADLIPVLDPDRIFPEEMA